jgi:tRNA threonylcarbamoyladenosine biosynthesis protein TsaB
MKILALDTSTSHAALGICDDGRILAELTFDAGKNRGESLAPALQSMLGWLHLAPADIEAYAVGLGPGSFTGLRTGLAFVKGLHLANPRPVAGVSTLEAIARNASTDAAILPLIDAKKGQVFAARFRRQGGGDTLVPHLEADKSVGPTRELVRETPDQAIFPEAVAGLVSGLTLILGDGLRRYAAAIQAAAPNALLAPEALWPPRASVLAAIAAPRLLRGQADNIDLLAPVYVRYSDAELGLAAK